MCFCEPIMSRKKQQPIMLQQYLISIDARLRSRNSIVSVKAETAECLVARCSQVNVFRYDDECGCVYIIYPRVRGFNGICGLAQNFTFNVEEEKRLHYFTHICKFSPYN